MTKTQVPASRTSAATSDRWAGWVVFASIMLCVIGALNVVQGLVALTNDTYFLVRADDHLLLTDFTGWGIVLLVWAAVQIAAGLGLNSGHGWARVLAVVAACVSILIQILFLSAYPIWSTIIIAIDVFVIFALTARWAEAREVL
jgi:hypothetical protein